MRTHITEHSYTTKEYTVWSLTDLGVSYRTIGEIGVAREKVVLCQWCSQRRLMDDSLH